MENTKKFLDSLKALPTNPTSVSPVQEEESDLLDAPDKNADVVDETLAKDSNPGTDLPSDVDKDKQKGGHMEFGNLGFFSFCDQDDELDVVNNESEVPVLRGENDAAADENSQSKRVRGKELYLPEEEVSRYKELMGSLPVSPPNGQFVPTHQSFFRQHVLIKITPVMHTATITLLKYQLRSCLWKIMMTLTLQLAVCPSPL